jgi:hypothetical protein
MKTLLMKHLGIVSLVIIAASCSALQALAGNIGPAVPLSDLLDGQAVVSGDKRFDQFGYSATGEMPEPGLVNVVPIQDEAGYYGIQFQGLFMDLFSSQGGSDALISYRVTATEPLALISDAHLFGNPELVGDVGSISVTETFTFDDSGENQMSIFDDETDGKRLRDWTFFPPTKVIHVRKDIGAIAGSNGSVTLSFVDQTFSQILIPEPSSAILMLIGSLSLTAIQLKRRRWHSP